MPFSDHLDVRITDTSLRAGSPHQRHPFPAAEAPAIVAALAGAGGPVVEVARGDGPAGTSVTAGGSKTPEQERSARAARTATQARRACLRLPGGGGHFFFFQAEDGIRDLTVTGVQTCALPIYEKGKPVSPKMQEMALARLRQLAAHEVGHTLGLMHNYSASTVNRSSVMDYPPPYVKLAADGTPDVSSAYATGIGEWDRVSIAFGYQDFAPGTNEAAALSKILLDAFGGGLRYLTDQDARPAGSSSSMAHLWDSGSNAGDELIRLMQVRGAALERFGENNIREGAPLATLEDVLVPLYLLHRYQVEAASKLVGGMDYTFALRGDGQAPTQIVAPAEQRRALAAVLATLKPDVMALPEPLLKMIPPRPPDYERGREHFKLHTRPVFDALAPAEAAAQHALQFLFNPERAARLVEFHALNAENPALEEVLETILAATWKTPHGEGSSGQIANVVDMVALYDLMALAANDHASDEVRAIARLELDELHGWLNAPLAGRRAISDQAHVP